MLSFQKWFLREPPASPQTDSAFSHILTSSVDPALLIPPTRSKRSGWVWPVSAVTVLIMASTSKLWTWASLLTLGLFILTLGGSILLLWKLPKRQTANLITLTPEARFDKENESRKTLAQIVGGLLLIASLFATARTLQVSQEQAATAAKQVQVAQEGQFTDRFTKAIDQLGRREQLEVRLGGIYALERIAKDSPKDFGPVMEVLTAFVRENSPRQDAQSKTEPEQRVKVDIQAILTVLGRRNLVSEDPDEQPDLNKTDLRGADLRGAKLIYAKLKGADLRGAVLSDAHLYSAILTEADLREGMLFKADLRSAMLFDADLRRADLSGADLRGANLANAKLRSAMIFDTDFREATGLTQSQIDNADGDSRTQLPSGITRPNSWKAR